MWKLDRTRFMSQYLVSAIHGTREFFVTSRVVIPLAVIEKKRYQGREPWLLSQEQKKKNQYQMTGLLSAKSRENDRQLI